MIHNLYFNSMNFGSRNSNSELSQIINEKIYKVLIKIHKRRLFKCYASKFLDSRKDIIFRSNSASYIHMFIGTKVLSTLKVGRSQ